MRGFGLFLACIATVVSLTPLTGCGPDPSPGPSPGPGPTLRSCASLGWVCGVDDYGLSCGTCSGGRSCSFGTCLGASCTPVCGGRNCGIDPVCCSSCGTCFGNQTCSAAGVCTTVTQTCTLTGFSECTVGGFLCCAPLPDGTETLCSTPSGSTTSYCQPRCSSDATCDRITGTSGRWQCGARGDGIRVCFPRL